MFMLALRAVVLDGRVFQEVKDRQEAMFSALGIVGIAGVALGLGVWSGLRDPGAVGFVAEEVLVIFVATSTIIFGWFLWTAFVWLLGARLFKGGGGDAGFREIMRALGVCYAPMWLSLLGGMLPYLIIVGALWTLVSGGELRSQHAGACVVAGRDRRPHRLGVGAGRDANPHAVALCDRTTGVNLLLLRRASGWISDVTDEDAAWNTPRTACGETNYPRAADCVGATPGPATTLNLIDRSSESFTRAAMTYVPSLPNDASMLITN